MAKLKVIAATLAGAVVVGGAIAQAAISRHVSSTVKLVPLARSGNYPNPGSKETDVGTTTGTLGRGAVVQHLVITGHPAPTTYTFKGTNTTFYAHGTIRGAFAGTATAGPTGNLTVSGHGHFTGGTVKYAGARGKWSFSGSAPPAVPGQPTPLVAHVGGRIRY